MKAAPLSYRYFVLTALCAALALVAAFFIPHRAQAAVSSWLKGANLTPRWNTDFGSDSFKQSVQNLHSTGANYAVLVIPLAQSNVGSTDVGAAWNTPTDDSLAAGIDYAHSLGLSVALKFNLDSNDGQWRAHINPGDRNGWFAAYQSELMHYAQIAQAHHVELMVLGTELVDMASYNIDGTNTSHWQSMIAAVRGKFTGALTYDANSNSNNPGDTYSDEKASIGFWNQLDYAGLSAYYSLNSDDSVQSLKNDWNYWNTNDLKGFQAQIGKPILFTEVGYRSVGGAHYNPWDYNLGGGQDQGEQANDYEALMSYWNDYSWMQGVFWWNWSTDPNAGGGGDTGYTPQNKQAQSTMTTWFSTPSAPQTPPSQPSFQSSAAPNPSGTSAGSTVNLNAMIKDTDGPISNVLVDVEVYDGSGKQVYQQYYDNQSFTSGGTNTYPANWSPQSAGTYTVKIGVFSSGWSQVYNWNDSAATVSVSGGTSGGGGTGGGRTSGPAKTDIWWPSDGTTMSGTQPIKAMVEGYDISQYTMYWQVDQGGRIQMGDSQTDYPHKEALVDFSGWSWNGHGPYKLTFTSVDSSGATISQASVNIYTQ